MHMYVVVPSEKIVFATAAALLLIVIFLAVVNSNATAKSERDRPEQRRTANPRHKRSVAGRQRPAMGRHVDKAMLSTWDHPLIPEDLPPRVGEKVGAARWDQSSAQASDDYLAQYEIPSQWERYAVDAELEVQRSAGFSGPQAVDFYDPESGTARPHHEFLSVAKGEKLNTRAGGFYGRLREEDHEPLVGAHSW